MSKGKILVTGAGGYVGSLLCPALLRAGYHVIALDLFMYGEEVLGQYISNPNLEVLKGDIRDNKQINKAVEDCDTVIHLACISNDPSFDLNPNLGKSINLDAFEPLVLSAKRAGVKKFIYASSSSVYGVKSEPNVTEEMDLQPLTDYSKYKAMCEDILLKHQDSQFTTTTVRPATLCGWAPRQRLDVIVNILTNHAINTGQIQVFGGEQMRPNLHITDMVDLYLDLVSRPADDISGKIYNVGSTNHTVNQIAKIVQTQITHHNVLTKTVKTDDNRSYHISSNKIGKELGFYPKYDIKDAVTQLRDKFLSGAFEDPMNNPIYHNVRMMQKIKLV